MHCDGRLLRIVHGESGSASGPLIRTPADEVHDLQTVAFVEMGFTPAVARDDVAVQFYGDPVGFHSEEIY